MKKLLSLIKNAPLSMDWKIQVPYIKRDEYIFAELEKSSNEWTPPFHWYENDSRLVLEWDILGLTPNDVNIVVHHRNLIISNTKNQYPAWEPFPKRKTMRNFTQKIRLPRHVQFHKGEARYQFGKLNVSFPKTSQLLTDRFKSTWLSLTKVLSTKLEVPRYN